MARRNLSQMPLDVNERLRERFWSKVRKLDGDDTCWLWTGAGRGNGYGAIKVSGVTLDAHVVSWRIENNGIVIPDGMLIAHRCDVRLCVRPDHLFLATPSENMRDARDKGRLHDSWSVGEKAHNSVLTEEIVRKARQLKVTGLSSKKIAEQLGASHCAIKLVLAGKRWKHVV